jgi:hypothetical protein
MKSSESKKGSSKASSSPAVVRVFVSEREREREINKIMKMKYVM